MRTRRTVPHLILSKSIQFIHIYKRNRYSQWRTIQFTRDVVIKVKLTFWCIKRSFFINTYFMSTKNKLLPHGSNNYAYLLSLHCEILTDFLPCTNFNSYCRINKHFITFIYTGYTNYYKEHLVSWYFSHILYNY